MRTAIAGLLCSAVTVTGLAAAPPPHAAAVESVSKRLYPAIEQLPTARETRRGYDREKFRHWIDANGDCQDTRGEVLAAESRVNVSGCDIQAGSWYSYYDGATTRDSSSFDVDHLVPLAEAWDSGAKRWNAATRQRFANDLGDSRTLVAVSASSNRSKSDRDPAEWVPDLATCKYVRQWVAVKIRWRLKVDVTEKRALRRHADGCQNSTIRVRRALVRLSSGGDSSSGNLDPRFDTCTEAKANGYGPYVHGSDPEYDWYTDGDSDGTVCE